MQRARSRYNSNSSVWCHTFRASHRLNSTDRHQPKISSVVADSLLLIKAETHPSFLPLVTSTVALSGPLSPPRGQPHSAFPIPFRFSEGLSEGINAKGKRREKFPCCSKKLFSSLGNAVLSGEKDCLTETVKPFPNPGAENSTVSLLFLSSCGWTLTVPA